MPVAYRRLTTLLSLALVLLMLDACMPAAPARPTPTIPPKDRPTATPLPAISDTGEVVPPRTDVYVDAVRVPVGLTFAPDGRLFFSEAFSGVVRIAERANGSARLLERPFIQVETAKGPETGMLGIAVDPDFASNHWVYVYYSEPDPNRKDRVPLRNRVVRFTEENNVGVDMTVILDNIGISRTGRHNGGVLRFGPDGKLYVTVGNAEDRANSQNLSSLNGKILRLNRDGSVPSDNPFPGSLVYALGFRNPFGLTFEPETNAVWATDNSGDNNDEIDQIRSGGNYGFPNYEGFGRDQRFEDPVWSSGTRTLGITGLTFYAGDQLPQYWGDLFFCAVNTGALTRLRLTGADHRTVGGAEEVANACHLDVTNGPDGALYFASMSQILRLSR
jgi:aldose sugar dehydrogenase